MQPDRLNYRLLRCPALGVEPSFKRAEALKDRGIPFVFTTSYDAEVTRVGYAGGDVPNVTYRKHGTHAEAIEITYDPARTSFRLMLKFFFQIHDPTTPNRQGNDRGLGYRSAIYYIDDDQRRVAEDTIADVDASKVWPGKVVTEVAPVGPFWEAEPEHQDYLERRPGGYTRHFVRPNWVLPVRTPAAQDV